MAMLTLIPLCDLRGFCFAEPNEVTDLKARICNRCLKGLEFLGDV